MNELIEICHKDLCDTLIATGHKNKIKNFMILFQREAPKEELKGLFFKKKKGLVNIEIPDEHRQVIDALVSAERVVQSFLHTNGRLIYYFGSEEHLLLQEIQADNHYFKFIPFEETIMPLLTEWYEPHTRKLLHSTDSISVRFSEKDFEDIHIFTPEEVEKYITMEDRPELKQLILDLQQNESGFNYFTYINLRGKDRVTDVQVVLIFIPGPVCIWVINSFDQENDIILIKGLNSEEYISAISEEVIRFFKEDFKE